MSRYSPIHDRWCPAVSQEDSANKPYVPADYPPQSHPQGERSRHSSPKSRSTIDQSKPGGAHSMRRRSSQWTSERYDDTIGVSGVPDCSNRPTVEARATLASTWTQIWNKDPLADSDHEEPDVSQKKDFERRVAVLKRLKN